MLYFRVVAKEEELGQYLKDPTYTKIEICPKDMKNFNDYKLKCCLPTDVQDIRTVVGMLKAHSSNPNLPQQLKEKIGGYAGHYSSTMWIGIHDFKELKKIEKEYKISFCFPRKYDVYLN